MTRIWFDVLKRPRSWSFTQIIHPILPRIWCQIWYDLLRFSMILGYKLLSFSIILGQSFSDRWTLYTKWLMGLTVGKLGTVGNGLTIKLGAGLYQKRFSIGPHCSRQRQARLHTVGLWWPRAGGLTASLCAGFVPSITVYCILYTVH